MEGGVPDNELKCFPLFSPLSLNLERNYRDMNLPRVIGTCGISFGVKTLEISSTVTGMLMTQFVLFSLQGAEVVCHYSFLRCDCNFEVWSTGFADSFSSMD